MLSNRDERGRPCHFRSYGKAPSLAPFTVTLAVNATRLRTFLNGPSLLEVFLMGYGCIFSRAFSASAEVIVHPIWQV